MKLIAYLDVELRSHLQMTVEKKITSRHESAWTYVKNK